MSNVLEIFVLIVCGFNVSEERSSRRYACPDIFGVAPVGFAQAKPHNAVPAGSEQHVAPKPDPGIPLKKAPLNPAGRVGLHSQSCLCAYAVWASTTNPSATAKRETFENMVFIGRELIEELHRRNK
jgi:hypothetical protein